MNSLRKSIVWSLSLVFGLSLYVSSSCDVLCFGDQGHVKMERSHLQPCCDIEHPLSAADMGTEEHRHDCVGCSDIPLNATQWWQRGEVIVRPIVKTIPLSQVGTVAGAQAIPCGSLPLPASGGGQRPAVPVAVTTTVLRC